MSLPVIVLGAGGHARVLIDALRRAGTEVIGTTDRDPALSGQSVGGVKVLGGDEALERYARADVLLVNGVGSVDVDAARQRLFERLKERGFRFATVVHPSAVIAADVVLAEGAQIMAGVILQAGSTIGKNVIINTRAAVDHDCRISDHVHIAPGATLSGGVTVGNNTHIGTGASIIHNIHIGRNCLIAAGAAVVRDVPDGIAVGGVPAKEIRV